MNSFADELLRRITDARRALHTAREESDLDAERVYGGELDSLLHLARENDVHLTTDQPREVT